MISIRHWLGRDLENAYFSTEFKSGIGGPGWHEYYRVNKGSLEKFSIAWVLDGNKTVIVSVTDDDGTHYLDGWDEKRVRDALMDAYARHLAHNGY